MKPEIEIEAQKLVALRGRNNAMNLAKQNADSYQKEIEEMKYYDRARVQMLTDRRNWWLDALAYIKSRV